MQTKIKNPKKSVAGQNNVTYEMRFQLVITESQKRVSFNKFCTKSNGLPTQTRSHTRENLQRIREFTVENPNAYTRASNQNLPRPHNRARCIVYSTQPNLRPQTKPRLSRSLPEDRELDIASQTANWPTTTDWYLSSRTINISSR